MKCDGNCNRLQCIDLKICGGACDPIKPAGFYMAGGRLKCP
jgi:hypothetical protein